MIVEISSIARRALIRRRDQTIQDAVAESRRSHEMSVRDSFTRLLICGCAQANRLELSLWELI